MLIIQIRLKCELSRCGKQYRYLVYVGMKPHALCGRPQEKKSKTYIKVGILQNLRKQRFAVINLYLASFKDDD
jgi:hypothetical protein